MRELFFAFVKEPSAEAYLKLCDVIAASESYKPYSNELREVQGLIGADRLDEARERIAGAFPSLLTSPQAHLMLALIAQKRGQEDEAQLESYLANVCARGIEATGDGSEARPYHVLRTSDEYDLLAYQQKEMRGQALIQKGDRYFDRLQCGDGSEVWFDITRPYKALMTGGGDDVPLDDLLDEDEG